MKYENWDKCKYPTTRAQAREYGAAVGRQFASSPEHVQRHWLNVVVAWGGSSPHRRTVAKAYKRALK